MGVSANLLINQRHDTRAVQELLEAMGYHTEIEAKVDHAFIHTKKDGKQIATFYVAKTQSSGGLDATLVTAGSREEVVTILKRIQKVTGGFLQESDSGNQWTEVGDPHAGNSRWVLDHMIRKNLVDRDNEEFHQAVLKATGYTK